MTPRQALLLVPGCIVAAVFFAGFTSIAAASTAAHPEDFAPRAAFIVNSSADPGDPLCTVVTCSLRAAINAANAEIPAGSHIIEFNLAYPAVITLTSQLPPISGTLAIIGPGYDQLVLSGDGQYRVLEVAPGSSLMLSGLSIRGGNDTFRGGGILVDHASLYLDGMFLAENMAGGGDGGGLHNDGGAVTIASTIFLENSAFHHGAISNSGNMTVTSSLFSGNHARIGGAIFSSGSLTVTATSFFENLAPQIGGGAINNSGRLVIANSTFYRNGSTLGADIFNAGSANVTHSTFYSATLPSMNSIASSGAFTLSNTLLAAGPGIENCSMYGSGALSADAFNLATDATCGAAVQKTLAELALGSYQDHGGLTPTIDLLPGSAAIDAALDAVCLAPVGAPPFGAGGLDQRGITRPQGAACDIGAFEYVLPHNLFLPWLVGQE